MAETLFLASRGLGALPSVLHAEPRDVRLVFVATAGLPYESSPWVDADRVALVEMGFLYQEVDFAHDSEERIRAVLSKADVVFVSGGNTYYLLEQINRCNFRQMLSEMTHLVYAGVGAGAVVAGPDIGHIQDLDDPGAAPELVSTKGLDLVDLTIVPYANMVEANDKLRRVLGACATGPTPLVRLNDDQAVIHRNGEWSIVHSP